MQLQLTDGTLAKPLGMLERVTVTRYGISFMQTFAIVDFAKNPIMRSFLDDVCATLLTLKEPLRVASDSE